MQSVRCDTNGDRARLLRDDVKGFFNAALTSSLSTGQASAKIARQIGERASLKQVITTAIELLRAQATEIGWLAAEIGRLDAEIERRNAARASS